jgi:hypothetical protein
MLARVERIKQAVVIPTRGDIETNRGRVSRVSGTPVPVTGRLHVWLLPSLSEVAAQIHSSDAGVDFWRSRPQKVADLWKPSKPIGIGCFDAHTFEGATGTQWRLL